MMGSNGLKFLSYGRKFDVGGWCVYQQHWRPPKGRTKPKKVGSSAVPSALWPGQQFIEQVGDHSDTIIEATKTQ